MANAIALNTSDESQIRRRRLPLELQCELFTALPLEHASRLLLLSNGINNNCISHVRKLHGKWKEFSDPRVNELVQRYHPRLPAQMRAIEKFHLCRRFVRCLQVLWSFCARTESCADQRSI